MKKYLLLLLISSLTLFSCKQNSAGTDGTAGSNKTGTDGAKNTNGGEGPNLDKIDHGQAIGVDFSALSKDYVLFTTANHTANCPASSYTKPTDERNISDKLRSFTLDDTAVLFLNCYASDSSLTATSTPKGASIIDPDKLGVLFATSFHGIVDNADLTKQTQVAKIAKIIFNNPLTGTGGKNIDPSTYAAKNVIGPSSVNGLIIVGDTAVIAATKVKNHSLLRYFINLATTPALKDELFATKNYATPLTFAAQANDLDSLILLSRVDKADNHYVNKTYTNDAGQPADLATIAIKGAIAKKATLDPTIPDDKKILDNLIKVLTLLSEKGLTSATVGKSAADAANVLTNPNAKKMVLDHLKELGYDNMPTTTT